MSPEQRIGVYVCHAADSAEGPVDLQAVAAYAAKLPGVRVSKVLLTHRPPAPEGLAREVRAERLTTIVVAGDRPGYVKPAFASALSLAGADPEQIRLASFQEHATKVNPLERAKAVVACAVHGVPFGLAAQPPATAVKPATLVIGGGVAGIQASLEIADAGFPVYLVERQATIGGHMAMFDKTFPTLDCAACILTPKMVSVGQHEKIELLTLSDVQEVTGQPGDYRVKVLKHATRIDPEACVACSDCAQFCPVTVPSEFDAGTGTRKAVFIPFPQAVPNAYAIDPAACTWVQSGGKKCGACVKKCAKGAVHLDMQDEVVELEVGNIIVTTGYDTFDARGLPRYGYGTSPNVLTALEFERLSNASGPTGGKIAMKSRKLNKRTKQEEWVFDPEGQKPRSVAIIHCVGSRDVLHNPHCSRVCCMYSLKFAHLVHEKLPDAEVFEYFIDMRASGKGYEEFYERIKEEGVRVTRGRSAKVIDRDGQLFVRSEDILAERVVEQPVDLVLLAVGLQPTDDAPRLAKLLGIDRGADGWFDEMNYNAEPNSTEQGGIFVAGTCQGPKDIPDTVAQASAVAARVLRALLSGRGQRSRAELTLAEIERNARRLAQP